MDTKLDITKMIVGKMVDGGFKLTMSEEVIGEVDYSQGNPQFHLNQAIPLPASVCTSFRMKIREKQHPYVYDCDKGWC